MINPGLSSSYMIHFLAIQRPVKFLATFSSKKMWGGSKLCQLKVIYFNNFLGFPNPLTRGPKFFPLHYLTGVDHSLTSASMVRGLNALEGLDVRSCDGFAMNTLPKTNSSPLQMDGWNTTFLLGRPIFRGEPLVSGRVSLMGLVFLPETGLNMVVNYFCFLSFLLPFER